jgi:hypothetical protein
MVPVGGDWGGAPVFHLAAIYQKENDDRNKVCLVLFSFLIIYSPIFKTPFKKFCQHLHVCQKLKLRKLKTKCETGFIADKRHVYSLATNVWKALNEVYNVEKKYFLYTKLAFVSRANHSRLKS